MQAQGLDFSLIQVIEKGLEAFVTDEPGRKKLGKKVSEFLKNRMVNILTDQGFSKEAVNSALGASFDNVPDVLRRVRALDVLRNDPDFEPLAITFKRVENILKKAKNAGSISVDTGLFDHETETNLHQVCSAVASKVNELIDGDDYETALKEIATLRPQVDTFFDDVMVFADDEAVKNNRIALLASVSSLFKNIADFSKL